MAELRQPFWLVHQEKIPAEAESPRCGLKKRGRGTGILPSGIGIPGVALTAGKIGGIGHTDPEETGGNGHRPQIAAYTVEAFAQMIPFDILKGCGVGGFVQLNAGDGAACIPGTEEQPQCGAAGAQIEDGGVFRQLHKIRQHHRIGA